MLKKCWKEVLKGLIIFNMDKIGTKSSDFHISLGVLTQGDRGCVGKGWHADILFLFGCARSLQRHEMMGYVTACISGIVERGWACAPQEIQEFENREDT